MTNGLGLEGANKTQGFDVIPAGTQVTLVMKIRPGNIGIENLLKRTSKGDAAFLDAEFTVKGGTFNKRKIFANLLLDGTTAGHAKAGEISRTMLRAIFEAVHGINPNDNSPATMTRRSNVTLSEFNGATFLAVLEVEKGSGFYKDKNVVRKVLRLGDHDYQKLDQPPPAPVERSVPPQASSPAAANGAPAAAPAPTAIARPNWAE
jgi:hypothetical protein